MKKIFYSFIATLIAFTAISCVKEETDKKTNIYVEKHKLYDNKDTIYTGINVYYAKIKGHDVIYHVINGKKKCDMDVWHFEDECAKCKKTKK